MVVPVRDGATGGGETDAGQGGGWTLSASADTVHQQGLGHWLCVADTPNVETRLLGYTSLNTNPAAEDGALLTHK